MFYQFFELKGFALGVMLATLSKMCLICCQLIKKIRILNNNPNLTEQNW